MIGSIQFANSANTNLQFNGDNVTGAKKVQSENSQIIQNLINKIITPNPNLFGSVDDDCNHLLFILRSDAPAILIFKKIWHAENLALQLLNNVSPEIFAKLQSFVDGTYKYKPNLMSIEGILNAANVLKKEFPKLSSIIEKLFKNNVEFNIEQMMELVQLFKELTPNKIDHKKFLNQCSSLAFWQIIQVVGLKLKNSTANSGQLVCFFVHHIKFAIFSAITESNYNNLSKQDKLQIQKFSLDVINERQNKIRDNMFAIMEANLYDHNDLSIWLKSKQNDYSGNSKLYGWLFNTPLLFAVVIDRMALIYDSQNRKYSPNMYDETRNNKNDDGVNYLQSMKNTIITALSSEFDPLSFENVEWLYNTCIIKVTQDKQNNYKLSTTDNIVAFYDRDIKELMKQYSVKSIRETFKVKNETFLETLLINRIAFDIKNKGYKTEYKPNFLDLGDCKLFMPDMQISGFNRFKAQNPYIDTFIAHIENYDKIQIITLAHYPDKESIEETFKTIVAEFESSISQAKGSNDRIKAIEIFIAKFELSHFFMNGNVRMTIVMRMKLYEKYGLPFSILPVINGWSNLVLASQGDDNMDFIVNQVKEGMWWFTNNIEMLTKNH